MRQFEFGFEAQAQRLLTSIALRGRTARKSLQGTAWG